MRFESKKSQNEGKKKKRKVFYNLKKTHFLQRSFVAGPFALHFKDHL